jgi:phenylacetate-CoA ligase
MQLPDKILGILQTANSVAARARDRVPAYRTFLEVRGVPDGATFAELPVTDKASYLTPSPYADLLADDYQMSFSILRSSGTSGSSFFWPQLKEDYRWTARRLRGFLESTFRVHERKTVAVIALSLGSWAGGEHFSWSLKNVALETAYPLAVFSPGNRHDEIIEFVCGAEPFVDQIIIAICPSKIGHLLLQADTTGRPLPLGKIRFLVTGEAFPETLRSSLCRRAGLGCGDPFMLSIYGSADTGSLGVESVASIALRRLLADRPKLARELGLGPIVPHFFHLTATDAYLETVGGELCVTRWQGIPIVRYNLHDSALLLAWSPLRQAVLASAPEGLDEVELRRLIQDSEEMPDLLAISGRTDDSVTIGGTKLTEAMLDEVVACPALSDLLTGSYRAALVFEGDRPILSMDLELKPDICVDTSVLERAYRELYQVSLIVTR